jgi:hypothetical protein
VGFRSEQKTALELVQRAVKVTNHKGKYDESAEHLGYVEYCREKSLCANVLVSWSLQCHY